MNGAVPHEYSKEAKREAGRVVSGAEECLARGRALVLVAETGWGSWSFASRLRVLGLSRAYISSVCLPRMWTALYSLEGAERFCDGA